MWQETLPRIYKPLDIFLMGHYGIPSVILDLPSTFYFLLATIKTMRGAITFVFDDGYERVYQSVLPLLRKYKVPGVFALPLNSQKLTQTEGRDVRPWEQWLGIQKEGHEVASHTVNHPNLTTLTPAELEGELKTSQEKLGATTLVYPGGAHNDDVVTAAKKYYSAARTVKHGFETLPPRDPMHLKCYNFTRSNFSPLKANLLALYAWLTNSWLIETYHMVDDNEAELLHSVKTSEFEKHLQYISNLPIPVRTIRSVIEN